MCVCVCLDDRDRKMLLLRGQTEPVLLSQSGVSKEKIFVFFDQIHTTGMDVKMGLHARAAITLSHQMTHRDFSQGAYRMRGIGKGQTLTILVTPEAKRMVRRTLWFCLSGVSSH